MKYGDRTGYKLLTLPQNSSNTLMVLGNFAFKLMLCSVPKVWVNKGLGKKQAQLMRTFGAFCAG